MIKIILANFRRKNSLSYTLASLNISIYAGILLCENGVFHAMLGARTHARTLFVQVIILIPLLLSVTLRVFDYSSTLLLALRWLSLSYLICSSIFSMSKQKIRNQRWWKLWINRNQKTISGPGGPSDRNKKNVFSKSSPSHNYCHPFPVISCFPPWYYRQYHKYDIIVVIVFKSSL